MAESGAAVLIQREILSPVAATVEITATAGKKCSAKVSLRSGLSQLFLSESELPDRLSEAVVNLLATGRILLHCGKRTFSVAPKALGGGCQHASHLDDPMHLPTAAGTAGAEEQHDLHEVYSEGADYERLLRHRITEKHFNMQYFESCLTYIVEHADQNERRNAETVHFLKTLFYRVFLAITKSGQCIKREVSDRCREQLTHLMRKVPQLSDSQRLALQMLQSGLHSLSQSTLVTSPELMTGLGAAYDVLTSRRPDLSRSMPLTHVFFTRTDFLTSLAVELVLYLGENCNEFHFPYILAVLNAAAKRKDRLAGYLLDEIVRYLKRAVGWVPDYSVLLEGVGELQGLSALVQSEGNPDFAAACKLAMQSLEKCNIPELQEVVRKSLNAEPEDISQTNTNSS